MILSHERRCYNIAKWYIETKTNRPQDHIADIIGKLLCSVSVGLLLLCLQSTATQWQL